MRKRQALLIHGLSIVILSVAKNLLCYLINKPRLLLRRVTFHYQLPTI